MVGSTLTNVLVLFKHNNRAQNLVSACCTISSYSIQAIWSFLSPPFSFCTEKLACFLFIFFFLLSSSMKCVLSLGSESAKTKGDRASYIGRHNVISVLKENSNSLLKLRMSFTSKSIRYGLSLQLPGKIKLVFFFIAF